MNFWLSSLDPIKDAETLEALQSAKVILKRFSINEIEQATTPPECEFTRKLAFKISISEVQ